MRHVVRAPVRFRFGTSSAARAGIRLVFAACFLAALATTMLAAQAVTLQASADTTLKQGSPDKSFGSETTLTIKEGGSRVPLQFDGGAIAAAVGGGSLASAALQVYVGANAGNWGTTGRTVDIYQLTTAWTEAGATWNCAADPNPGHAGVGCTSPWSGGTPAQGANGASGDGEATDTALITNGTSGWVTFDVTSDVAAFLTGTANNGWLLQKTDEGQAGQIDLVSREGTAGLGPRLVLVSQSATSDTVPPSLAIVSPSEPVLVNVPAPAVGLAYQDPGSGVDTSTLRVAIDGQDFTSGCSIGAQAASCQAPVLAAGVHTIMASVSDHAGNVATATTNFQLLLGPGISSLTLPVSADTFITATSPDREHGRAAVLRVEKSGPSRALVGFAPGSLAAAVAGNQVLAAQLQLGVAANAKNWGAAGRTIGAYRLTTAWSEAAATWDCPADTNLDNAVPDCAAPWSGGSFVAAPTATALITRQTTGSVSFDVTADVTAFFAGTATDGWLIAKTGEGLAGRIDFTSREASSGQAAQLIVEVQVPSGGTTPPVPLPSVVLTLPVDGAVVSQPTITATGTVVCTKPLASVTVNGQPVSLAGNAFSVPVSLGAGPNVVLVLATDVDGNVGTASAGVTLDTTPPIVTILQPLAGALINSASALVQGQVSDDTGVASLSVAGTPVTVNSEGSFQAQVALNEGNNLIPFEATDVAGNKTDQALNVIRFSLPQVAITSPPDLSYIAATTVAVSGTVSDPAATVSVNGQPAQVSGGSFMAPGVPLLEGGNVLTATTTDSNGHVNTATINVVRDLTAPVLSIAYPQDGATVFSPTLTVSGLVNDIVAGTVNASQVTVTVNGQPAAVANRSFSATLSLIAGENLLTVRATDVSGNTSQATVTVQLKPATVPRVTLVAGAGQSAPIGTLLGSPLVAALLDGNGQPVAGQSLYFRVRGNDGTLNGGQRGVTMTTNASGQATVNFTLGRHAGTGNQVVEAFAPGFQGPAVFQETAVPGSPSLIVVDSGDQQVGIPGQLAPRPLVVVVTDSGFNRLPGVAVQFGTVKGQGSFPNGDQVTTAITDSDGRAIVNFTLDPSEGISNNAVRAIIAGLSGGSAANFVLSGRAAGNPAATTVSGVVLDNANHPVPGVTASIRGTAITAQTDAAGHFQLTGVAPGTPTLIIDGSTAQLPGAWPDLEYLVTVIAGRDNTVNMPIYMLPLDQTHGIQVSETVGGTLTLPQVPGFALTITPGSVTFPNGARSGLVSVTVVHGDKVPMVPNFGQQPRLIVTIQPAGARFDPPARLTFPNVEGLVPGSTTEMYSFDHDLGHFVSIGPATVSDDGATVTANPGVGVIKAGWHCCGNPATSGVPFDCPQCKTCDGGLGILCVPDPTFEGKACPDVPPNICRGGDCVCAIPTNFQQTLGHALIAQLNFIYQWGSSTGHMEDLAGCQVAELIFLPSDPYTFPKPWVGKSGSPYTTAIVPGSNGVLNDTNTLTGPLLPIGRPIVPGQISVTQYFTFKCPCYTSSGLPRLFGPIAIVRSVAPNADGSWNGCIQKSGLTSCVTLPPN